jgi:hypothetical protein
MFVYLVLCLLLFKKTDALSISVARTDNGDEVIIKFVVTPFPIGEWAAFDNYTVSGCESIQWTAESDYLSHSFSYTDVVTTCSFTETSPLIYDKLFTVLLYLDEEPTEQHFYIRLEVDDTVESVTASDVIAYELSEDSTIKVEHNIALTRINCDGSDYSGTAWEIELDETFCIKVTAEDVSVLTTPVVDIRKTPTDDAGASVLSVTDTDETTYIKLSTSISSGTASSGSYKHINVVFDHTRRTLEEDFYAVYPIVLKLKNIKKTWWIPLVVFGSVGTIIMSAILLVLLFAMPKFTNPGKYKYESFEEEEEE